LFLVVGINGNKQKKDRSVLLFLFFFFSADFKHRRYIRFKKNLNWQIVVDSFILWIEFIFFNLVLIRESPSGPMRTSFNKSDKKVHILETFNFLVEKTLREVENKAKIKKKKKQKN
jgi:hypothetical protein